MRKLFYRSVIFLILFISITLIYLTYIGIKTKSFNQIILKKTKEINPEINLSLQDVYIKFFPNNFEIRLTTEYPEIIIKNNVLKLKNASSSISVISFLKKKSAIKNIKIESEENSIKSILKIIRVFENNFQTILAEKLTKNGNSYFNLNLFFNEDGKLKQNYEVKGYVKNLEFFYKKKNYKANFDFIILKDKYTINNSNIKFKDFTFLSKNIKLEKKDDNFYNLSGDISNDDTVFNLSKLTNIRSNLFDNLFNQNVISRTNNTVSFDISKKLKIKNFKSSSVLDINKINYNSKNLILKKIFDFEKEEFNILNNKLKIDIEGDPRKNNSILKVNGEGILINNKKRSDLKYVIKKLNNITNVNLKVDLKKNNINLKLLDYKKKINVPGSLEVDLGVKNNNKININKLRLISENDTFEINNILLNQNYNLIKIENINFKYTNNKNIKNKINLDYVNNKYKLSGTIFDASEVINSILDNNNSNNFLKDINDKVNLNISKVFIDNQNILLNTKADMIFKNGNISDLVFNSDFENGEKLKLTIISNEMNEQITTMSTNYPKPLISRYKFIKGFNEGNLNFRSIKKNNKSDSVLIIDNFKVKEVPALAKLLTLASLQGIADLLTGEGIRFTDFEMKFSNQNNMMEIDEIYAIGPAISILMSGYIDSKKLISLRGTLVPATTINRTISSIPFLGDILVGKKVGEGVFGVSFKIKGESENLKTTVNPIKTLTPRFITRTLEKIKKN